jgi:hypothetical protein
MVARILPAVLALLLMVTAASAQQMISARAGFVNYHHGTVDLPSGPDGKIIRQLEPGQTVSTDIGRVEILLSPGNFLRLDHQSSARLLSSSIADVRFELLSGTATVEINEVRKGTTMVLSWQGRSFPLTRTGLYRFEPAFDTMRIYVEAGKLNLPGVRSAVKSGRFVDVSSEGAVSAALKYNRRDLDTFDRWNVGRASVLAHSASRSVLAARSYRHGASFWYLDPFTGYFTYMPVRGFVRSPFGVTYYSPGYVFQRPPVGRAGVRRGESGSGGSGGSSGGGSQSGTASPAPTASAPPPPSAPRHSPPPSGSYGVGGGSSGSSRSIARPNIPE